MALLTAAEVREYTPGLSGDDTVINALVTAMDSAIAEYLGFPAYDATGTVYTLEDQTYTLYLPDGDADTRVSADAQTLYLPRPLVSVTSIFEDDQWGYAAATEVASTNWTLDLAGGRVMLNPDSSHGGWDTAPRALKVTAVCGYTTPTEWLKSAAKLWVAHVYGLRSRHGKQSLSGMQVSESLRPETMPDVVRQSLTGKLQRGAIL